MLDFIDLPDYFDRNKFFNAFQTLETKALYAYFRCNNSTTFANLMRKYFPDRPLGMPTAEYVCGLIEDERNFNKELGIEPSMQQVKDTKIELVKPQQDIKASKTFMKTTGGEPDPSMQQSLDVPKRTKITFGSSKVDEWDKPVIVPQPRIRTELDIWTSKQLFKDAGRTAQNLWLKAGHPDPNLETEDAPYDEEHVFTNLS